MPDTTMRQRIVGRSPHWCHTCHKERKLLVRTAPSCSIKIALMCPDCDYAAASLV